MVNSTLSPLPRPAWKRKGKTSGETLPLPGHAIKAAVTRGDLGLFN